MTRKPTDDARRLEILAAAKACFLQYGFQKTSLDDIAKRARISRPLIYRKFKNKEEICAAVFESDYDKQYPQVEAVLAGRGTKRAKLERIVAIMLLEPWAELAQAPAAAEFYEICVTVIPEVEAKYERARTKYVQALVESKEVAEAFWLSMDGLIADLPSAAVLAKRVEIVVDRFTRAA